jgi:hypothetical protein
MAFLLQRYHDYRLPGMDMSDPTRANLFSVLGTVGDFIGDGVINRQDLQVWLNGLVTVLRRSLNSLCHLGFECERANAAQI